MTPIPKLFILLGLTLWHQPSLPLSHTEDWEVINTQNSVLTFKNGSKLNTNLYDVGYIGTLEYKENSPIVIIEGVNCTNCDATKAIYLFTPGERNKKFITSDVPFDYPVQEFTEIGHSLKYQSRMFYGNVLPNVSNGIIWYQTMLNEDGSYEKSIYLINITNGRIKEGIYFNHLPSIKTTLQYLSQHKCKELLPENVPHLE